MLNRSASLAMSTCVLKALPDKLDIKRHSPSILYLADTIAENCMANTVLLTKNEDVLCNFQFKAITEKKTIDFFACQTCCGRGQNK